MKVHEVIVTSFLWLVSLGLGQGQVISFGMRKLAYSSNQFGLDLMRAMDNSESSTSFCPFCISSSLSMMLAGAHGTTATSLRHALYLWGMQPNEVNMAFHDLMSHLGVNMPNGRSFRRTGMYSSPNSLFPEKNATANDVSFLTNIYVQRDFPINYHYHMLLQKFYKTAVHPLDFHFNGEETRQHINAIVERQTGGKIKDILPGLQSPATQLLLVSSLFFKGTLDLNLVAARTHHQPGLHQPGLHMARPATLFGEDPVMLESRQARIRHRFDPFLNCTAVEMPFKGGLITLVLLMPSDPNGMDMLLTRLSAQILTDVVNSLDVKRVNLRMPRLSFEKGSGNLTWALSNLGLADLFKPGYAQLYDVSGYKWLSVSDIIHKTFLDIKESGGEEPRPSVIFPPPSHVPGNPLPKQPDSGQSLNVNFDQPFIYFVFDNISGLVMVMGKVGKDSANYRLPI